MKRRNAHGKLLGLLYLLLIVSAGVVALAGLTGLWSDAHGPVGGEPTSYDQAHDAFDQIVPGMTNAQDLPSLGFDPEAGKAAIVSHADIATGDARHTAIGLRQNDPGVRACINAQRYCIGYVFGSDQTAWDRWAAWVGLGHRSHGAGWSATLLVMNGRVVYKAFSAKPDNQAVGGGNVLAAFVTAGLGRWKNQSRDSATGI